MEFFQAGDMKRAIRKFEESHSIDPTFSRPLLVSITAYANLGDWDKAKDFVRKADEIRENMIEVDKLMLDIRQAMISSDLEAEYAATRKLALLSPNDMRLHQWGLMACVMNKPKEALEAFRRIDLNSPRMKTWSSSWWYLSLAYHLLGQHKKELKTIREARKKFPDEIWILFAEIRALAALGEFEAISPLITASKTMRADGSWDSIRVMRETARELRAHGHREAALELLEEVLEELHETPEGKAGTFDFLLLLGRTLYQSEKWDKALEIFEELVKEKPEDLQVLSKLGFIAARKGDTVEAQRIYSILEQFQNKYSVYYQACLSSLLGDKENSVRLLREAVKLGYPYVSLHADMDLEPLLDYPPFQEFMKPKD
jgi:tetratricopeptide (TPR) repeat protein